MVKLMGKKTYHAPSTQSSMTAAQLPLAACVCGESTDPQTHERRGEEGEGRRWINPKAAAPQYHRLFGEEDRSFGPC